MGRLCSRQSSRYKLITKGLILPIDLGNVPNYSKIVPDLQKAAYTTVDGQVYSVPLVHGPYGLGYNTALFSPAPDFWNIFWDPKYTMSADYFEVNIYMEATRNTTI